MRVILYSRVSTDHQVDGVSLDDQARRLAAWAVAHGHEVVATESDEGLSASSLARPALARALAAVRSGDADAIVVTKLDRLTRSIHDLSGLVAEGLSFVSLSEELNTTTAAGRMLVHLLAVVAQWERQTIGERTKAALAHLRSQGVRLGRPPLATDEQRERARTRRAEGATLQAIADELSTPERRWSPTTVRRVLA